MTTWEHHGKLQGSPLEQMGDRETKVIRTQSTDGQINQICVQMEWQIVAGDLLRNGFDLYGRILNPKPLWEDGTI
jgi:hypothetical protein